MAGAHFEEMPVTLLSAVAWVPTAASEKVDRDSLRLLLLRVVRRPPSPAITMPTVCHCGRASYNP